MRFKREKMRVKEMGKTLPWCSFDININLKFSNSAETNLSYAMNHNHLSKHTLVSSLEKKKIIFNEI